MSSKTNKEVPIQNDQTASLEDRTAALLEQDFGEIPKAHMDLYKTEQPQNDIPVVLQQLDTKYAATPVSGGTDLVGERLVPALSEIFQGADHLVHHMQRQHGLMAGRPDEGREPKTVKINRSAEPDSLYEEKPNKQLPNLIYYFLVEVFGSGEETQLLIDKLFQAKNNMNTGLVSLIRQRFWDCFKKRKFRSIPEEYFKGKLIQDTQVDNMRLKALLEENVYDELKEFAETLGQSNKFTFAACLKFALFNNLIEGEALRPW